jgi:hypothetical protein
MSRLGRPFYGLTLNPEDKVRIHEEIFNLAYNSNGGFTHDEVYSMPIFLRYFYIRMLIKQRQLEKQESERNTEDSTPTTKGPPINRVLPRNVPKK